MGHHRKPAQVLAGGQAQEQSAPIHVPLRVGSERPALQETARALPFSDLPTWAGRPISRWTRWGCWNEDGSELTVTRVL